MKKRKMTPAKYIASSFTAVILLGAFLLSLPACLNNGFNLSTVDALFTATSAVCITGLTTVDPLSAFSPLGRAILALLIQIGGLGVASVGVGLIMLSGKKINMRARRLAKEGLNYPHFRGVLGLVRSVLLMTLFFEAAGMLLGLLVFARDYPLPEALGLSAFHAISAFNNAGFDILPGDGLLFYHNNAVLFLATCVLTIAGSLGFFVIHDIVTKRRFRRFSLHSKVVLATSGGILLAGTLLLKATGNISWLAAFFVSAASRTSGFASFSPAGLSSAALLILMALMFIGGSPGSTAGGIKTTTFFVLIRAISATISGKRIQAFHRSLPQDLSRRALVVAILGMAVIIASTLLLCLAQPQYDFMPLLFEAVSAAATVGLSTGITPELSALAKIILIVTMFIGRLGLLTMATMWLEKPQVDVAYAEESVSIG